MLRPVDLQVVIVKGIDNVQNVSYSQQMMSSAQQTTSLEEQRKAMLNQSRVLSRDKTENLNFYNSKDGRGGGTYNYNKHEKNKKSSDPYRGKVIDVRL